MKYLRPLRILVSLLVFLIFLQMFTGIDHSLLQSMGQSLARLQLLPSILRFFALFFSVSGLGFLLIFLLSWIFGRVYCSSLCPMGTFQDIIARFSMYFRRRKKRKYVYSGNRKLLLRYGVLGITLIAWMAGSLFLVNLLDPYSNFGKISVSFFQPLYIWSNNTLSAWLESREIYLIAPMAMKSLPANVLMVSGIILLTISIMAAWRGRLFCNTLCPVGSMLGLISARSVYRIRFQESACNGCGKCERVCKAECINSKTQRVDMSRCVACFNCIASCPQQGLKYAPVVQRAIQARPGNSASQAPDSSKRRFLSGSIAALVSIPWLRHALASGDPARPGMVPTGSRYPVSPPGSKGFDHFTRHCIACYLCVSVCPKHVLVPSVFDYGSAGFMQPRLDFHKSFCNYDCVRCSEVCPTGAIKKLDAHKKQGIQIGVARFMVESCIVSVDRTDCGACSEHCPTKAVHMVPWQGLFLPEVTPDLCVGCGACEYACPTQPYKAIYVESNTLHQEARRITEGEGPREVETDDFPF